MKDNFYTEQEIDEFYKEWEDKIEEFYNHYGSSHFVGFFSNYINTLSQEDDEICSIHSDMASACLDIYLESKD